MVSGQFIILVTLYISQGCFLRYIKRKIENCLEFNPDYVDINELELPEFPIRNPYHDTPEEFDAFEYNFTRTESLHCSRSVDILSSVSYQDTSIYRTRSCQEIEVREERSSGKPKKKSKKKKGWKLLILKLSK